MEKFSKEKIEIRKPPTYLYYLAGFILLFLIGFAAYYFGYYRYFVKPLGGLTNQVENVKQKITGLKKETNENRAINEQKILIDAPKENEAIGNPVIINGQAEVFDATFNVRIKDANGKILGETVAMIKEEQTPSPYEVSLSYATSTTEFGLIEAFDYSAEDSSVQNLVSVKVKFGPVIDCVSLKEQINKKVEVANYCQIDSDCVIESFNCPFGCGSYLNKDFDISEIKKDIEIFQVCPESKCEYGCTHSLPPVCLNNKCVGTQCEINKQYKAGECECPAGTEFTQIYNEEEKDWFYICQ